MAVMTSTSHSSLVYVLMRSNDNEQVPILQRCAGAYINVDSAKTRNGDEATRASYPKTHLSQIQHHLRAFKPISWIRGSETMPRESMRTIS
jgi:hypothetical protein